MDDGYFVRRKDFSANNGLPDSCTDLNMSGVTTVSALIVEYVNDLPELAIAKKRESGKVTVSRCAAMPKSRRTTAKPCGGGLRMKEFSMASGLKLKVGGRGDGRRETTVIKLESRRRLFRFAASSFDGPRMSFKGVTSK